MDGEGPAKLSPKQARSIIEASAPINVWEGSVSSGKTLASIIWWLDYVANKAPRTGELLMIGKTIDTLYRNVLSPAMDLFPTNECPITYTRGSSIARIFGRECAVLGAADARSETRIRGVTGAGAYVDEGSLLPDHAYYQQLVNRLRVPGARLGLTTNPDNPTHWLKSDVIDEAWDDPEIRCWHFTLDDNPGLSDEYKARIKRANRGLWYKRNILGQWVLAEGAIYEMFDPEVHVIDDHTGPVERWIVAIDYGTAGTHAAHLIGVDERRQRIVVADEWRWVAKERQRQLTDVELVAKLHEWVTELPWPSAREPYQFVVDPSATSLITQMHRSGFPGVRLADNTVSDGIRGVASLMGAHRLVITRRCPGLIGEVPGYVWDPKAALVGEDKPVKLNDHSLDAVRYGVRALERWWRYWLEEDLEQAA